MNIQLYYAPITCAMAPFITLTEAGAEFEVKTLNFGKQEHMSPEYLKINPKHKVPMLVVDGKTMTENAAIHLWISRTWPDAKIMPEDPWDQAQAVSLLSWCSGGIHPFLTRINNPAKVCPAEGTGDAIKEIAIQNLHENFAIADEKLAGHDYFMGDFMAPDAHFFWCCRRAQQFGVDLSGYKNIMAHHERMKTRDSVKKLLQFEADTLEGFKKAA